MKNLKTLFVRAFLLNKRLLKKISFIIILCLIPLLTLAMTYLAKDESGILTITLCSEDLNDPLANEIIDDLIKDEGVLHFKKANTKEDAYEAVISGTSDASWIFHENLQNKINSFAQNQATSFITVVERETDVSLQLSHEKLCGVVYPYISKSIFKDFMLNEAFEVNEITEKDIVKGYNEAIGGGNLVVLERLESDKEQPTANYLTAPLRGILCLVVLLCGLAAVMYHQSDKENKIYDWLSPKKQIYPGIATTSSAVFDALIVSTIALAISGMFTSVIYEISSALMYLFAVTSFCTLLGSITRKSSVTGRIIPFVMIISLVISPIFFNLKSLHTLQSILPTYYYLYAVYQPIYILYGFLYSSALLLLSLMINKVTVK